MERQNVTKASEGKVEAAHQHSARPGASPHLPSHPFYQLRRALGNLAFGRFIQAKLKISQPSDEYEQEADRMAETVMRMADPEAEQLPPISSSSGIQRQVSDPVAEDELVKALEASGAIVQRQVNEEVKEDESADIEEELLQARATGEGARLPGKQLVSKINSLEGGGQPLSSAVRSFMEPRFGQDFSRVRVHNDSSANAAALGVNAHAFTIGHHIAFASGQYSPETSAGQHLLAHELSHVVQQGDQSSRIHRKILIGGKPYTPSAKYYAYLDKEGLGSMKEFIKNMHNDGNPPTFTFTTAEQMGTEVRVRYQITKGMDAANFSRTTCDYPDSANPDYIDSAYWDRKSWMNFVPKSPLPSGKDAADAIEAIFAPGAGTRLECMAMTVAVEYYSLLKGLGKARFNALFPGGVGLEISTRLGSGLHPSYYGATKIYKNLVLASKAEILPGDWVYFKNIRDYIVKHPGGSWQGENAIYMGGGKYRGFGVSSLSEADMNAELVRVYNNGLPPAAQKTVAALLAEGGGLQLAPVYRPDMAKLAP